MEHSHATTLLTLSMLLCMIMTPSLGTAETSKPVIIPSTDAIVVLTQESMGCLNKQTLEQNVFHYLANEDSKAVIVQEIKNSEDISNRYELYISFPASSIGNTPSFLILKLWCNSSHLKATSLSVDHAILKRKAKDYVIDLKAKTNGVIQAQLLYSLRPQFNTTLVTYPEADVLEPTKVTFFSALYFISL